LNTDFDDYVNVSRKTKRVVIFHRDFIIFNSDNQFSNYIRKWTQFIF